MWPTRSATERARPGWVSRTMFVTSTVASALSAAGRLRPAVAFIVILALSSFEMGQPLLAVSTAFSNFARSALGIFTVVSRWLEVTANPPPTSSRLTVALVSMLSAVIPSCPRNKDNAIEKHAACAAAISSSGLVPFSFSNRMLKL